MYTSTLSLIFFQWIGQIPPAGPPGSWSSQITEAPCFKTWWQQLCSMWPGCCEADKAPLVNFSTDKTVKYCVFWLSINKVLMSLIWLLSTASVIGFQGKNTTIIHLLFSFSRLSLNAVISSLICILKTSSGQHSPIFCDCLVTTTEAIVEIDDLFCLIVNMLPFECNLYRDSQR